MSLELIIFVVPILILSIVIHELAHGYAALFLGDKTAENAGRLTLNPISHMDLWGSVILPVITLSMGFLFGYAKPVPYNPSNLKPGRFSEAIVAAAGPLSNFILATIFILLTNILGTSLSESVLYGFGLVIVLNIFLGIFNLIPFAPLDGSKILFAFLPYKVSRQVRAFMEAYWLVFFSFLLVILFTTNILGNIVNYILSFVLL
jgi:Zn-dependent protease